MKANKKIHSVKSNKVGASPRGKQFNRIKKSGVIIETLPNTNFKVKLDDGNEILAHLAGKLRMYRIKVLAGDRVTVELSPYDQTRGRIVYRGK